MKRFLSIILAIVMVAAMLPAGIVSAADAADAFEHEFVFSQAGFNVDKMLLSSDYDGKPVLREANSALYFTTMFDWNYEVPAQYSQTGEAFMALDTTEADGDAKLTDKWKFIGSRNFEAGTHVLSDGLKYISLRSRMLEIPFQPQYAVFRLSIEAPGEYDLQLRGTGSAAYPAVYFFKDGQSGVVSTGADTYPAGSLLGYINPNTTAYTSAGKVKVEEAGDYILAFQFDATSAAKSASDTQTLYIAGAKLVPILPQRTYEYITTQAAFDTAKMIVTDVNMDTTPVLRAANNAMYYTQMMSWKFEVPAAYSQTGSAFMAMDLTKTDKWEFVGARLFNNPHILATYFKYVAPTSGIDSTGASAYSVFRINVDAAGEYTLQIKGSASEANSFPAIYFFKDGLPGVYSTSQTTYPAGTKLGYFDSSSTEYVTMGTVNVAEPGDYIVSFMYDDGSKERAPETANHILSLTGIKLVPNIPDEITSISIAPAKASIVNGKTTTLSAKANWTVSGEKELDLTDVALESSNGNVSVSADGTIKGLAVGSSTITATLKSDTSIKATANIEVLTADIKYDFNKSAEKANEAGKNAITFIDDPTMDDFMPEGISTNWTLSGNSGAGYAGYRWDVGVGLRLLNICSDWQTYNALRNRAALDIEISADQAGWYRPNIVFTNGYSDAALAFSVYMISGDKVTYLGEHAPASNGLDMNPIYLAEGTHTLILGLHGSYRDYHAMWIKEITLKNLAAVPTMATFAADIPTSIAVGSAPAEISAEAATMSDGGNLAFAKYGADTTGASTGLDAAGTSDYIKVESSDTSVATVERVDADTWTLTPVSDGETTITVTPYYNGVAYEALKQTKTVFVTYPNASVNYNPNFIVNAVVGEEGLSAEAASLVTSEDIAIGEIASATLGTTVKLTATSGNGLKFLYWYNGNSKKMLSDEAEYSFKVGTKAAIYAKYARVDAELVEYFSAAGQLIDEVDGTFGAEPSAKLGNYYKLYKDTTPAVEGESVTATSDDANFVCWKKDGKVVSYDKTYTYYKLGDEEVVAVTEGEKSDIPAVVLFTNGDTHMLELVNFDGVEIVEKGILFADSGNPTVNNFGAKAVASEDTNQFIASSDASVAVAYVIYRDGGNYRVAYSAE